MEADHAIRGLDGAEPVRDDERGAVLEQCFHRALHARLGVAVHAGRRFVEHDDLGVAVERAGEGDQLALAAREVLAALVNTARSPPGRARKMSSAPMRRRVASTFKRSGSGWPRCWWRWCPETARRPAARPRSSCAGSRDRARARPCRARAPRPRPPSTAAAAVRRRSSYPRRSRRRARSSRRAGRRKLTLRRTGTPGL